MKFGIMGKKIMTEDGPTRRKIKKCYKELHPAEQQGRYCTCDVTLKSIRVTIITVQMLQKVTSC